MRFAIALAMMFLAPETSHAQKNMGGLVNPFDPARAASLAAEPIGAAPAVGVATIKPKPPREVLCGIEQSLDGASLCVDGQWVSVGKAEALYKIRIVQLGPLSAKFASGAEWEIGRALPRGKTRALARAGHSGVER